MRSLKRRSTWLFVLNSLHFTTKSALLLGGFALFYFTARAVVSMAGLY